MKPFVDGVKMASKTLTEVTMTMLMGQAMKDREVGGAIASNYLNLFALTTIAYLMGTQAQVALERQDKGKFYKTKVKTARYFMANILPEIHGLVAIMQAGKEHMMAFDEDEF